MTLNPDYQRDWPAYFDAVRDQPARETLLRALEIVGASGSRADAAAHGRTPGATMIDLACGSGRDVLAALNAHPAWIIHATDSSADALARLASALPPGAASRVTLHALALEDVALSAALPTTANLINASFALPFCREDHFPALWAWIRRTLARGGVFAGQFFGDRDDWAHINPRRHVSRERALALLDGFTLDRFDEVEKDGSDAMGGTKHHHVFHVVAIKN